MDRGPGVAFLLSQLGFVASSRFADVLGPLELTPPKVGFLRAVSAEPGRSQQAVAEQLGLLPSRVVALVDELTDRGLLTRDRDGTDRRRVSLRLTPAGEDLLAEVGARARDHEKAITAPLSAAERRTLATLLTKVAEHHDLAPGVHPGYHRMGRP